MARQVRSATSKAPEFENIEPPPPPPLLEDYRKARIVPSKPTELRGRKLRKAIEKFEGGLFRCLANVRHGDGHSTPGEIIELTAEQAYPIREHLERVEEYDDEVEVEPAPAPAPAQRRARKK